MTEQRTLTRAGLKTPRAAAIAGMVFSVLLIVVLLRLMLLGALNHTQTWFKRGAGRASGTRVMA